MKRFIEDILIKWKDDKGRKPLILSGARQVGKSYVIEQNFARHFEQLLSINFEKQPEFHSCFESGYDPARILRRIEALAGQRLTIGRTLLFFDEVQFCPEAIISLGYFFEEIPDLHIIAAGSLLEFTFEEISIPVDTVFSRIPHLVGNQFKFVQISRDIQSKYLRSGLELLDKADLVKFIYKTSGIPLGANYNPQRFKLAIIKYVSTDLSILTSSWPLKSYLEMQTVSTKRISNSQPMNTNRKLKQIIYNLLSNAVKFTPDNGKVSVVAPPCEWNGGENPAVADKSNLGRE